MITTELLSKAESLRQQRDAIDAKLEQLHQAILQGIDAASGGSHGYHGRQLFVAAWAETNAQLPSTAEIISAGVWLIGKIACNRAHPQQGETMRDYIFRAYEEV